MQCNTNYTADDKNFNFIILKVLNELENYFHKIYSWLIRS